MGRKTRAGAAALTAASLLSAWAVTGNSQAHSAGLVVEDIFGRTLNRHGLVLVDWEGYMANPAIKFYLTPPADAALPARAVLSAREPRLYFDLPSQAGPKGPRKEVLFEKHQKIPVHLSIFPDRDGQDEEHRLDIAFTDAAGKKEKLTIPIRVIDQDRDRPEEFAITVYFSQDRTGFFQDEERRAVVLQAARDWAYFFTDTNLAPVPAGAETTLIWGPDGFKKKKRVVNAAAYKGYLLYVYGIKSPLLRSGGEPSLYGEFQQAGGKALPIRRSGGVEVEVQGNYNTKGWLVGLADTEWWKATNLREVENDLYSIVHHEMGHALIFNPANRLLRREKPVENDAVRAYLGRHPGVSATDHLEGVVDPASLRGAFGNEFHGRVPLGRWLITKLDLLCAQALGYPLRRTSAFEPLALVSRTLPRATTATAYSAKLRASGGIPFYHWEVVAGALP